VPGLPGGSRHAYALPRFSRPATNGARPNVDSPLEGTGFEPSVPLGRIGASNSAWIEFGRRLGLRIEHAISIDGWEVCDGRTSWRFFMRQIASLTVTRACWSTFGHGPGLRQQERRAAVGLGQT
jgi:hypothetical protein